MCYNSHTLIDEIQHDIEFVSQRSREARQAERTSGHSETVRLVHRREASGSRAHCHEHADAVVSLSRDESAVVRSRAHVDNAHESARLSTAQLDDDVAESGVDTLRPESCAVCNVEAVRGRSRRLWRPRRALRLAV